MRKRKRIGVEEIRHARELLSQYRVGKKDTEKRIEEEEKWFRLRITPRTHANKEGERFAPTSAWLLNSILQKHADMMDNMPAATCLAREPDDEADARALDAVLPVILERGEFEKCYSDNTWTKLKHGFCFYGVFWNKALQNGMGDIDIRLVDPYALYFAPDVRDIQDSPAVFYTQVMEKSEVHALFPQCWYEQMEDVEGADGKVLVVDWYYKKRNAYGKKVLHYAKFSGDALLFSTENDPSFESGWYEHGEYPFVVDVMYPEDRGCMGFGMISIAKNPQTYIDRMDRNLLEYMDWATRVRYFCKKNTGINESDFLDINRRVVEVEGDVGEERLRQITVEPLAEMWLHLKNAKIDELKETTFNRNVLQGYSEGGITAAAAIAALQEAGKKGVRDVIASSFRAYVKILQLVISCVRQFYDEERFFRVMGEDGYQYISFSGRRIRERPMGVSVGGIPLSRVPIFDIDVHPEKQDSYTNISNNENLKDLYRMGIFSLENREAAMILLDSMDFPGVKKLRAALKETKGFPFACTPSLVGASGENSPQKARIEAPNALAERGAERLSLQARDNG